MLDEFSPSYYSSANCRAGDLESIVKAQLRENLKLKNHILDLKMFLLAASVLAFLLGLAAGIWAMEWKEKEVKNEYRLERI